MSDQTLNKFFAIAYSWIFCFLSTELVVLKCYEAIVNQLVKFTEKVVCYIPLQNVADLYLANLLK